MANGDLIKAESPSKKAKAKKLITKTLSNRPTGNTIKAAIDTTPQTNSDGNVEDLESHKTTMSITESRSKIYKSI